jgi:hypothetical protein
LEKLIVNGWPVHHRDDVAPDEMAVSFTDNSDLDRQWRFIISLPDPFLLSLEEKNAPMKN